MGTAISIHLCNVTACKCYSVFPKIFAEEDLGLASIFSAISEWIHFIASLFLLAECRLFLNSPSLDTTFLGHRFRGFEIDVSTNSLIFKKNFIFSQELLEVPNSSTPWTPNLKAPHIVPELLRRPKWETTYLPLGCCTFPVKIYFSFRKLVTVIPWNFLHFHALLAECHWKTSLSDSESRL